MSVETDAFSDLCPFRYICLTFPNPDPQVCNQYNDLLRIAILDSPVLPLEQRVAAMFVPKGRENDWIFSTEDGHFQLLFSNSITFSRLILIGNIPHDTDLDLEHVYQRPVQTHTSELEQSFLPLILALSPKSVFRNGQIPDISFLHYEDLVIRSILVERGCGTVVGEMIVEDVEIDVEPVREFRRRLRFRRMPYLLQTEIRVVPDTIHDIRFGLTKFQPDTNSLVPPYLQAMVASLSLVSPFLEQRIVSGSLPCILCIGVGGGSLLSFIRARFGFRVLGVESDAEVLLIGKQHFGLCEDELMQIRLSDGIEPLKNLEKNEIDGWNPPVDAIMIDLDCGDAKHCLNAPPLDFFNKDIISLLRSVLHEYGILAMNVIPPSESFYRELIGEFQKIFSELYDIDVSNGESFVLIAVPSPSNSTLKGGLLVEKLKMAVGNEFMDRIRKI